MKKVFISCPIKGRAIEDIQKTIDKMYRCAKVVLDEELEMILPIIAETLPSGVNERIRYLDESVEKLSRADLIVTLNTASYFIDTTGWDIETRVAVEYGIPILRIDGNCFKYFCPDLDRSI